MAQQWYEPFSLQEWLKRAFSFLNLFVLVVTVLFVFSEFRFDWFEKIVGSYLVSTNDTRPKTGPIWETGEQTSKAYQFLNTIVSKREESQKSAHQAASFSALAQSVLEGEWVTLEKQEFKALYLSLQRATALKIIDPSQLVWLLNGGELDRIFCEGTADGINVYFIDSENRVIRKIAMTREEIVELEGGIKPVPGRLEDMAGFANRIFDAHTFFEGVFKLPADIIPDLITHPEVLLKQEGRITRVGIWNESRNGYIRLGFQIEAGGQSRVVFLKGREWAVWQLSLHLKGNEK